MTRSAVVYTDKCNSETAGLLLGKQITDSLNGSTPDVVVVFASSQYEYTPLLKALKKACNPKMLIGCSSAGEFISGKQGEGAASALALSSDEMQFNISIGRNLNGRINEVAGELAQTFKGLNLFSNYPYKTGLILIDALAGHTDAFIEKLNYATAGTYQFFGGGAGDDANFSKTHVFYDEKAYTNSVVALEILSYKPLGIGVGHGWEPVGSPMRVTESNGTQLISLNSIPVLEMFRLHADETKQVFNVRDPVPFFLHNVIGIKTVNGYYLRVPLAIQADGSIVCASDIPLHATVAFMKATVQSASEAAKSATLEAVRQMNGQKASVALVFDCVATRLRTGREFVNELNSVQNELNSAPYAGCNTYGQITRIDGQFSGFHNCTAVVCVIPA